MEGSRVPRRDDAVSFRGLAAPKIRSALHEKKVKEKTVLRESLLLGGFFFLLEGGRVFFSSFFFGGRVGDPVFPCFLCLSLILWVWLLTFGVLYL